MIGVYLQRLGLLETLEVVPYPGVHRYWRVHAITGGNPQGFWSLAEVEFRATVSGPDETEPAGQGTAIYSQQRTNFEAFFAFDNDSTSDWSPEKYPTTPIYIGYDFGVGNDVRIVETSLAARSDGGWQNQMILNWKLEYSDNGTTWFEVSYFTGVTAYGSGEIKVFTGDYA